MKNTAKPAVTIRKQEHQPSSAEMNEKINVHVPSGSVAEKMNNFGSAVPRSVNVSHDRK